MCKCTVVAQQGLRGFLSAVFGKPCNRLQGFCGKSGNSIIVFAGFHWISREGMTLPSTSTPASTKTTRKSSSAIPNSRITGGRRTGQLPGFHLKLENPSRYQKNPFQLSVSAPKALRGFGQQDLCKDIDALAQESAPRGASGQPPPVLPWLSPALLTPSCSSSCPGHNFSPLLVSPWIMKPFLFTLLFCSSGWTGFCNVFSLLAALHEFFFPCKGGSHCGVLL